MTKAIAWRYWNKACPVLYVQDTKPKVGDWGYTDDPKKALPLSPYWQRRFAADCRDVGEQAHFSEVANDPCHALH